MPNEREPLPFFHHQLNLTYRYCRWTKRAARISPKKWNHQTEASSTSSPIIHSPPPSHPPTHLPLRSTAPHPRPPGSRVETTSRVRDWCPPPQVAEHAPHWSHSDTSVLLGWEDTATENEVDSDAGLMGLRIYKDILQREEWVAHGFIC